MTGPRDMFKGAGSIAALVIALSGCAGSKPPPGAPEPAAPAARPEPTIGEGACSAVSECDGGRQVVCDGVTSCNATKGLGCRAERASGEPAVVQCCDGTQSCAADLTPAR